MENGIEMQQQNTKWTAQQIVDMIIAKIGIPITSRGQHNDSGEYWSGIKQEVLFDDRIGTHIEYHATFANRHPPIPQLNRKQLEMQRRTDKAKRRHTVYTSYTFYSLVIEDDNQQSQGNPNCSRKIVINRCYLKASQVTPENIDTIAADYKTVIQNANASECKLLKFSPIESIVENKKIKTESRNMNKNIIRLTESQLHRVINESVKKVLTEKYDPFKKSIDDNGDSYYPRFEKDIAKYRNNLAKQAKHLAEQINFFHQTLVHANPSMEHKGSANGYEELQLLLVRLFYKLAPFYEKQPDYEY